MHFSSLLVALAAVAPTLSSPAPAEAAAGPPVNQTTCNGEKYSYQSLAGYGLVVSNFTDKYGDTVGGHGSAIAVDGSTWKRSKSGVYRGTIYTLPDRGWNTQGTLNYINRIHKWTLVLRPNASATVDSPSGPNIHLQYLDTILLSGPDGNHTTGIDGAFSGHLSFDGFPDLPVATWSGDGYGGSGSGGTAVPVDSEGLALGHDGTFWVSDEYGPYVYQFSPAGVMLQAIRPPDAFIPLRNDTESWSADSPPAYNLTDVPIPANNPTGRQNNHGFEGLTANPAGTRLYILLQAALNQDGGESSSTSTNTRMLTYDITTNPATQIGEYVVPLPQYNTGSKFKTASTSEFHYVSPTQFMILARDSGAGHGQSSSLSLYRHVDVFDISSATNVMGMNSSADAFNGTVADMTTGVLNAGITAATYCSWLDFNVNDQLNRFGVHNGGDQDAGLLNEKWESLALLPANPGSKTTPNQYILFSFSDNDFITQDGHLDFGNYSYADASGYNLDNQMLAFHVKLPVGAKPLKN